MSRVINDDAEFDRAVLAMVALTNDIENPDPLDDEEPERKAWKLNRTAELVQKYSRGRIVQSDPSRASYYKVMGWEYQIFT